MTGRLDSEPRRVEPPFDAPSSSSPGRPEMLAALHRAVDGVDLGSYDERILAWLAGWDTGTVGTVVSLLHRVRVAGPFPDADPG